MGYLITVRSQQLSSVNTYPNRIVGLFLSNYKFVVLKCGCAQHNSMDVSNYAFFTRKCLSTLFDTFTAKYTTPPVSAQNFARLEVNQTCKAYNYTSNFIIFFVIKTPYINIYF